MPNFSTGSNSSTPATTTGQLKSPSFLGNLGFGQAAPSSPDYPSIPQGGVFPVTQSLQASANKAQVTPTATGGMAFNPSAATAYSKPAPAQTAAEVPQGLGQFVPSTVSTANGGTLAHNDGTPTGYTSSPGFSIDPTGAVPSDALTSYANPSQTHSQYSDYVNALAQAQGYSPAYLAAQSGVYGAQAQGAQLGVDQAAYANQAFGSNQSNNGNGMNYGSLGGATTDFVNGTIGSEQSQNAIRQSLNTQQQTEANINLNTQQLARTGAISAAQSQLQYSPTGMTGQNAISQYNTLQQQYPGANIPSYNPSLSPEQNQQIASQMVAQSGAYQAGFQSTFTTPGGGTGIYSKLNVQGLQQNQDGTIALVPAAAAALGAAQAGVINTNLAGLSTINAAVESSSKTLASTKAFMQANNINDYQSPIANQIQNAIKAKTAPASSIAAFNNDLTALRSDYSQYLVARGGSIAGSGPDSPEVLNAIPNNISYSGIEQIVGQMQAVGNNTASSLNNQIQQAMQGLNTGTVQSTSGGSSGGSLYDF